MSTIDAAGRAGRSTQPPGAADAQSDHRTRPGESGSGFASILSPGGADLDRAATQPAYFADLHLDQIVAAVIGGRQEYALEPLFWWLPRDLQTIRYRQEVVTDLKRPAVPRARAGISAGIRRVAGRGWRGAANQVVLVVRRVRRRPSRRVQTPSEPAVISAGAPTAVNTFAGQMREVRRHWALSEKLRRQGDVRPGGHGRRLRDHRRMPPPLAPTDHVALGRTWILEPAG